MVCAEVLEHVPTNQLRTACTELPRVASSHLIIGVPFEQDLRVGQTTCRNCGKVNLPWGHVNTFSKRALINLFPGYDRARTTYVGSSLANSNSMSTWVNNHAGNPYGTYLQKARCVHCGCQVQPYESITFSRKLLFRAAGVLSNVQQSFYSPRLIWIHMRFDKLTILVGLDSIPLSAAYSL